MEIDTATAREEVLALMAAAEREPAHSRQVARLALRLHDDLTVLHRGGPTERFLLEAAALLHDIGWSVAPDGKAHHKHSARLIRDWPWTGLPARDVGLVAQIARYHRRSPPGKGHEDFMALSETDRRRVESLAGLLRVADGLDRSHLQKVVDVAAVAGPDQVTVSVHGGDLVEELAAARKKADLAERIYGRAWVIEVA
jgi:exopolyphosphatase / guanosine-5'-triphosphate,3'-diphosphate pyrophosphatase